MDDRSPVQLHHYYKFKNLKKKKNHVYTRNQWIFFQFFCNIASLACINPKSDLALNDNKVFKELI
jgi:hypothetical protein